MLAVPMGDHGVERWLAADLRADARRAPSAIQLKLEKLARDPFSFFRGTLPEYVRRVGPQCRGPLYAPRGVITGDLHLENLGTFQTAAGRLAFDLNDFDDVATAPLAIDLRRLAASARLAAEAGRQPASAATRGAEAVLGGFEQGLSQPLAEGLPVPAPVAVLHQRCEQQDPAAFVRTVASEEEGRLRLLPSATLQPAEPALRPALQEAMHGLRESTPPELRYPLRFYRVLDASHRLAGNGSLGRRRFMVLLAGATSGGGCPTLIDVKEPRSSPWGVASSILGERRRARQVERAARALRAESEGVLGSLWLGNRLFQVREHSAFGMKVAAAKLSAEALLDYSSYCGAVLARAWRRAEQPAIELGRALAGTGRTRLLAQVAEDAERALSDHAAFTARRERIAASLGLVERAA